jgi:pSer/pThr/pTyr-binding forkhead associated (FHA) protein
LELTNNILSVTDLESRNGTFVNGELISQVTLKPGDRVRFGAYEMEVGLRKRSGWRRFAFCLGAACSLVRAAGVEFFTR